MRRTSTWAAGALALAAACLSVVSCHKNLTAGHFFQCSRDADCGDFWWCAPCPASPRSMGVCVFLGQAAPEACRVLADVPADSSLSDVAVDDGTTRDPGPKADVLVPPDVAEDLRLPDDGSGPDDFGPEACVPDCADQQCGDDGCGGSCGACTGGKVCESGKCVCKLEDHKACCGDAVCWFDSCGGQGGQVVDCPFGCDAPTAQCMACTPACSGK